MSEDNLKDKELKHFIRFFVSYGLIIIFSIIIFWTFGNVFVVKNNSSEASIKFVVNNNQSVIDISSRLADDNIISSRFVFVLYTMLSGNFSKFKPGIYSLSDAFNTVEVVNLLASGPKDKKVTFYPGMTVAEMDKRLSENGFIEPGDLTSINVDDFVKKYPFLKGTKSLEGYLMPDTYYFYLNYGADVIADTMLDNFWKRNKSLLENRDDINRIVTIASLIEKEVVSENDKFLVSSVIKNRLKIGMPLQIDSSVMYGVCGGVFIGCKINKQDFKKDNVYNTYMNKDIPPTPISNPTTSSIEAAISPRSSDYLYYLSDSETKETFFSKTFDEHDYKRATHIGI